MPDLFIFIAHVITTVFPLAQPGGVRAVAAESARAKHQLLILNRSRRRSANLQIWGRLIVGFRSLWIQPKGMAKVAIAFKPSTLLRFHRALVQRKYRTLFSPKLRTKPGPNSRVSSTTVVGHTTHRALHR